MTKTRISASISEKLVQEAQIVAKKQNINFSQLIEKALINELNRKSDNGIKAELEDIKQIIDEKIALLDIITETDVEVTMDIEHHIKEIIDIHTLLGRVSVGVIDAHSKELGIPSDEFIKILFNRGYNLNIDD